MTSAVHRSTTVPNPFSDPITHRPPPPPPKPHRSNRMPTAVHDIADAVKDTVVLRDRDTPRTRIGRSQTTVTPPSAPNSRPSTKRSQSHDSAQSPDKSRSSGKARGKKSSQHADVIDRLDFTSVGLFHHDGPFDACAPSRNKQRNKAPMLAWSEPDPQQYGDRTVFSEDYPDPPKKKVDAIAEAWGIHEPEPYEEFFAGGGSTRLDGDTPASSIYNGRDSHNPNSLSRTTAPKRPKDDSNLPRPRGTTRRSLLPPPQPIFVPNPIDASDAPSSYSPPGSGSPGFPKRQKSLMQRIRKMRDAPNVPVGPEDEQPPSPNSQLDQQQSIPQQYPSRPTHKTQNSFLGRFGTRPQQSPERPEPYVFIDPQPSNNKDLPPPPVLGATISGDSADEFGSPGMSRRTSIMKKVGRAVRRKG